MIDTISGAAFDTDVTTEVVLSRPPLGLADDEPIVLAVEEALARHMDATPIVTSAPYWTDAALHAAAGTPAVVFGPAGEGLHEDLEWVSSESLRTCAATLLTLARAWCA